ncbi:MAG TPA: amidohydrolase family protein [Clostridia bacterium]|nr:amidohydrolase family protein [Clostridia bacterium]
MAQIRYERGDEALTPHAADVLERDYAEAGFARGWCPQAKPVPEYYFDFHVHYMDETDRPLAEVIAPDLNRVMDQQVLRTLLILRMHGEKAPVADPSSAVLKDASYPAAQIASLAQGIAWDQNVVLSAWLDHSAPDAQLVRQVAALGVRCIKLHNAPVIAQAAPADLWLSPAWQEAFAAMGELKLPVLWHVTQRLPSNAYTGGGRNTYWNVGWKNGVSYGNEELLQAFLACCRRFPQLNFVGAHQLHVGWERLDELFTAHPNLHVDTTVGCTLRFFDTLYPQDKAFLRTIFIKWADRILYGTDSFWRGKGDLGIPDLGNEHMNFLRALDLPGEALQKICHLNAERLTGLSPLD